MREMRRRDRRLDDDGIREILRIGEYGVLATVTAEGQPYSVPMSYAYDEENGAIIMHCTADGGQKIDDILSEPRVCFTVVTGTEVIPERFTTAYRSVNVFGRAELLDDPGDKMRGLMMLVRKYSSDYEVPGTRYAESSLDRVHVIRLHIDECTGKARGSERVLCL